MSFEDRLKSKKILVADGAWGTEMLRRGLPASACPELWNLQKPEVIREIAASYQDAGADIVLTNTFGGNLIKLEKSENQDKADLINQRGVELSQEGAPESLIFASMGPTGEFLEPLGMLSSVQAIDVFTRQAESCLIGGVDGFLLETFIAIDEALCGLKAIRSLSSLPVIVSLTFAKGPAGFATVMGITPEKAVSVLSEEGATAVGANCGSGIEDFAGICREMREKSDIPLWIKPNAGIPALVGDETVYTDSPEKMAGWVDKLLDAGATIIGGCCGTTPGHIRAIAKVIHTARERQ
ncbi:MAG: homocysteine S-methyltransferase family protein [Candidatus Ratteibacteria bacterium]|jgi:5-methyltetrahydrofolate--homocysteine methyltransferase